MYKLQLHRRCCAATTVHNVHGTVVIPLRYCDHNRKPTYKTPYNTQHNSTTSKHIQQIQGMYIATQSASVKKYTHTINLPQTTFNLHSNVLQREQQLHNKLTTQLYEYQKQHRSNNESFILHDGPPFANGTLHIGHYLNKTLKDMILRYKIQCNYNVNYIPGWDCHGLPIEIKALEQLKQQNIDLHTLNSNDIRQLCRTFAQSAVEIQSINFQQWGILGEWKQPYLTMSNQYECAQLDIFYTMYNKQLIYRALKPVYWSPVSKTALAEAELEYVDNHLSPAVYTMFKVKHLGELKVANIDADILNNLSVLIWTTTPWTLPANVAITYSDTFKYAIVRSDASEAVSDDTALPSNVDSDQIQYKHIKTRLQQQSAPQYVIIGIDRIDALQAMFERKITILHQFNGTHLKDMICVNPITGNNSVLIAGTHVTNDTGTCLVHSAPAHGHDDFHICKHHNIIDMPLLIDDNGCYNNDAPEQLRNKYIFTAGNTAVVNMLMQNNTLVHIEKYIHRYPYDWRSKTPVIIRTTRQWFCKLDQLSNQALTALNDVTTVPIHGKTRLINTIGTRSEWCISRQRHWGLPIPVFYHKTTNDVLLSDDTIQHVKQLFAEHGSDCWFQLSERELLPSSIDTTQYSKGTDTLDVWFDSGSSWNAIQHNNNTFTRADVYLEGSDQHRGWFQSSLLTCVALHNMAPYKTLITHGFVLDAKYRKMSKSIGNVIDPNTIIHGTDAIKTSKGKQGKQTAYGIDVLRLWVASVDYTNDVSIGTDTISKLNEQLKKLRTTMKFVIGNINDFDVQQHSVPYDKLFCIDQYMLHQLHNWQQQLTQHFNSYNYRAIYSTLLDIQATDLSALYFDICKDRLYVEHTNSHSRRATQTVLFYICDFMLKSIASIVPYTAEELYVALPSTLQQALHYNTHYNNEYNSIFTAGWYNNSEYTQTNTQAYNYINTMKIIRHNVNQSIHVCKTHHNMKIGSNVDVDVVLHVQRNTELASMLQSLKDEINILLITSNTTVIEVDDIAKVTRTCNYAVMNTYDVTINNTTVPYIVSIIEASRNGGKCPRCWKYSSSTHRECLCSRCQNVLQQLDKVVM